jgi:hypothetical protein
MTGGLDFSGMVPGFDFLQSLMKGAGSTQPVTPALTGFGPWVAPTLDPAELEKRIQELRTVQFWLEQNARLLSATIQAMEVQRMTLATLQTMNVPMADLHEAMRIKPAATAQVPVHDRAEPASGPSAEPAGQAAPPAVDPVKWWGALTQQFTEIANQAIQAGTAATATATATAPQDDSVPATSRARRSSSTAASAPSARPAAKKKPAAKPRSR